LIRNLENQEFGLGLHKSLVIVSNYLTPHHSLKNWENRIRSNDGEKIMRNKPRKSNENNFMTLLNFIVDPAVIVDEKGKFRVVNDAFMDLTGLSKKELIGTAFLDVKILAAESKAILLKNLMKRMQGLPVEPYEINFTDKTGKTRCAEVKAKKVIMLGNLLILSYSVMSLEEKKMRGDLRNIPRKWKRS